jgi:lysophospholipase L1-like esterase
MRTVVRLLLMMLLLSNFAWKAAARDAKFSAPKDYVLALGDSLTFGFQWATFYQSLPNVNPANFNTGYVDDFMRSLTATATGKNSQVVNYGCPQETTTTFLKVPCGYQLLFPLHNSFSGSQMQAAEAFLNSNRGRVGTILISLGSNDALSLTDKDICDTDLNCIAAHFPQVLGALTQNYATILTRLRAAAPDAEIIVLGLYNPAAIAVPATNALVVTINQVIEAVAATSHSVFVNPFPAFNQAPPQPQTLCGLTGVCTPPLYDIHPSNLGYQVISDLIWTASGYTRFER